MAKLCFASVLFWAALFSCSLTIGGETWPEFRGPGAQGISTAKNVPVEWSIESPAWKTDLPGNGWSSPVVLNGRIYVTAAVPEGQEDVSSESKYSKKTSTSYSLQTTCFDYESGENLWTTKVSDVPPETSIHPKNSHASPTPIVTNDRVFVHFGTFGTAALDHEGEIVWSTKIDYKPVHGSGGSPVLFEDLLILNCDGSENPFVIALEAATGEERWRTGRPDVEGTQRFSFSTPLLVEVEGQTQLISAGSHVVCGYDPRSGDQLWEVHYPNRWSIVPRPVFSDGIVLICTGYEGPAELLAINPAGRGNITETHILWRAKKFVPHNPSPIIHEGFVYTIDDDGIAACRQLKTGDLIWKERLGGNYSS
ncbi:MAG: PQQ-like beta-propeller repeat protein, partial [Planctomycetales bacterium]|nr:PQQ-like beta-propeller repeat protein [Planctomycetales bacterium]